MRRIVAYISAICLMASFIPVALGNVVPSTPLEAADLGAGVFAPETEHVFTDPETASRELLSFLEREPGMPAHLRAIETFCLRLRATELFEQKLTEVLSGLNASKREEAKVEAAFILGFLAQEGGAGTRAAHLGEIEPLLKIISRDRSTDPWSRLVAAMLFASFPELRGNWLDEALYAQCHGYDSAELQLAVGSFMLRMDLFYGGNERLQWFVYLALSRAQNLAPQNEALRERISAMVKTNLEMPGYRPSKWVKALAGS